VPPLDPESQRLAEDAQRQRNWTRWGPYLPERQWGTVREDYSPHGTVWDFFPHDHARSRAYRWGEDGLLGLTDRECRLCFAPTLWNGHDPILKERLFGLAGPEGNHGEDVKECYYYLDALPTSSYCRALYKYPQRAFPYDQLVAENRRRGFNEPEFELADTGIFDDSRYFDLFVEYAKAGPNDILIRITAINRGPDPAPLWLLPTLWYRNTWIWGCRHEGCWRKPRLALTDSGLIEGDHESLGRSRFAVDFARAGLPPQWLFTENETNTQRHFGQPNYTPYVKDAFHRWLIAGEHDAINPRQLGTKCAPLFHFTLAPGAGQVICLRLCSEQETPPEFFGPSFDQIFATRIAEADAFQQRHASGNLALEQCRIKRQAYAGLLWSRQFYHYIVNDWLDGDPEQPPPPSSRQSGRNHDWRQLYTRDILSMPDKWEYPWFAAWDLAFHMLPLAEIDPAFAKAQLTLLLREWYMHPNGQLPAYEFAFSDVNPPVHAWACWRVYKITARHGQRDFAFLRAAFHKLLINFTWWVNRKDPDGKNIFSGGFLGLDNIGIFDRSKPLPGGGQLAQADGTAWMAFYCSTMLAIALELAGEDPVYEDVASKFFEHFIAIVDAINTVGGTGLWHETDGFYYDILHTGDDQIPLRIRSLVGLIPLLAVEVLEQDVLDKLRNFTRRMEWFIQNRRDLARHITYLETALHNGEKSVVRLLAVPSRERLERVLHYLLDESEFLSPFGIRSLSKFHAQHPFALELDGFTHTVAYAPAESPSGLFGGNSNWRGPIWFPINYLLVEALERYHHFYGDSFTVECPTGSGIQLNLRQVAREIARRLESLFLPDADGHRPLHARSPRYATDPAWRDLILFYEFFDAETGRGCGASHQTGWTALVARWVEDTCHPAPSEPSPDFPNPQGTP
jgi:hypothetical protein